MLLCIHYPPWGLFRNEPPAARHLCLPCMVSHWGQLCPSQGRWQWPSSSAGDWGRNQCIWAGGCICGDRKKHVAFRPSHILSFSCSFHHSHSYIYFSIGLEAKAEKRVNNHLFWKIHASLPCLLLSSTLRELLGHSFSHVPGGFLMGPSQGGVHWYLYPWCLAAFGTQYTALCIQNCVLSMW